MIIKCPCAVCINKNPPVLTTGDGEVQNSGLVLVSCPLGHNAAIILEERKYMLLMISAVQAMADGHYKEAVSNFSDALERCYEFYFKATLYKNEATSDDILKVWKEMSNQSERQYGAFCAVYFLETRHPFSLPNSIPKFRNKAIHKGYIPKAGEVVKFGRQVYDLIKDISEKMEGIGTDAINLIEQEALDLQKSEIPADLEYATVKLFAARVIDEGDPAKGEPAKGERIDTFDELCNIILNTPNKKWGDEKAA